jgi:hypothetical protein
VVTGDELAVYPGWSHNERSADVRVLTGRALRVPDPVDNDGLERATTVNATLPMTSANAVIPGARVGQI